MRFSHEPGDKLFVDCAGVTLSLIDRHTGELRPVQIFVATLGHSSYTFAEATLSQTAPDWLASHVRAFAFFGGLPHRRVLYRRFLKQDKASRSRSRGQALSAPVGRLGSRRGRSHPVTTKGAQLRALAVVCGRKQDRTPSVVTTHGCDLGGLLLSKTRDDGRIVTFAPARTLRARSIAIRYRPAAFRKKLSELASVPTSAR